MWFCDDFFKTVMSYEWGFLTYILIGMSKVEPQTQKTVTVLAPFMFFDVFGS